MACITLLNTFVMKWDTSCEPDLLIQHQYLGTISHKHTTKSGGKPSQNMGGCYTRRGRPTPYHGLWFEYEISNKVLQVCWSVIRRLLPIQYVYSDHLLQLFLFCISNPKYIKDRQPVNGHFQRGLRKGQPLFFSQYPGRLNITTLHYQQNNGGISYLDLRSMGSDRNSGIGGGLQPTPNQRTIDSNPLLLPPIAIMRSPFFRSMPAAGEFGMTDSTQICPVSPSLACTRISPMFCDVPLINATWNINTKNGDVS